MSEVLNKLFKYKKLLQLTPEEVKFVTNFYPDSNFSYKFPRDSVVGIEVEVENQPELDLIGWSYKRDGSLRNGIEFVSYPLRSSEIELLLHHLYFNLSKKANFSFRTSTHIHLNVRNMTCSQLRSLILVYLCVEKLLFNFDGLNRDKGVFCVPLNESHLLDLINTTEVVNLPMSWLKYSAFNLCPIPFLGTVEFRHLGGCQKYYKILQWISLILRMEDYAINNPMEEILEKIVVLNTTSDYRTFVVNVFKEDSYLLNLEKIKENMESNITKIKLCFYPNAFQAIQVTQVQKSPLVSQIKKQASKKTGEVNVRPNRAPRF